GVILYELLTGRLPFQGSRMMILAQVQHDEPPWPRGLDRAVPRDLETVCLKALAKDPGRRYATAGALAEDLRRFLAGEPVRARPVGALERTWRWARRRPAAAGLLAAAGLALAALGGLAVAGYYTSRLGEALRAAREQGDEANRQRILAEQARGEAEEARRGEE